MTLEELNETISNVLTKIDEIKTITLDIALCKSEKSKAVLLVAASKLVESLKSTNVK